MEIFGNRQLEQVISGDKQVEKTSRRVRKLKKKALKISRVF